MPAQMPAGLPEAIKPFKALVHAWSLQQISPGQAGISDLSALRNALPSPSVVSVGDVRAIVRILESVYGEFKL